jgi:hypothetical protein
MLCRVYQKNCLRITMLPCIIATGYIYPFHCFNINFQLNFIYYTKEQNPVFVLSTLYTVTPHVRHSYT